MNDILNRVQTDFSKFQKSVSREGELLIEKLLDSANKAANSPGVVEKREKIERLFETQYKKFEPTLDRFYKDVKGTAEKYGVDVHKIEKSVIATTQNAARRFGFDWETTPATATDIPVDRAPKADGSHAESPKKKPGRKKGTKKA